MIMSASAPRAAFLAALLCAALLCTALAASGCGSPAQQAAAPTQSVVGLWTNAATKGQPASLSEIVFAADGSFRHSGNNALGLPVNFSGRYQVGSSAQGTAVRLVYDDFPDKPTEWFFRLDGDTLTLAPRAADFETEAAIVFRRASQQ